MLLLEAGRRDDHPFGLMPIAFPRVATDRAYVWPFESEPEPGLDQRPLPAWRGKMLGGCSSINAMINVRGNPRDFDAWARAVSKAGTTQKRAAVLQARLETSWRGENRVPWRQAGPVGNIAGRLSGVAVPAGSAGRAEHGRADRQRSSRRAAGRLQPHRAARSAAGGARARRARISSPRRAGRISPC